MLNKIPIMREVCVAQSTRMTEKYPPILSCTLPVFGHAVADDTESVVSTASSVFTLAEVNSTMLAADVDKVNLY